MSNREVSLKSIKELSKMNFFIPAYQRGYRWEKQQALDLLQDIWDFMIKEKRTSSEIYCIQPLVVQREKDDTLLSKVRDAKTIDEVQELLSKGTWTVIDGQQRLTTIYLIWSCLKIKETEPFRLEYETRKDSWAYLQNIQEEEKYKNIDF